MEARAAIEPTYEDLQFSVVGSDRYYDKPDKNEISPPHDALQYLMSGAGEGRVVMRKDKVPVHLLPTRANKGYDAHRWRAGR